MKEKTYFNRGETWLTHFILKLRLAVFYTGLPILPSDFLAVSFSLNDPNFIYNQYLNQYIIKCK